MNEQTLKFIEHHGVKGMKWGVRNEKKNRAPSGDFKKTIGLRGRPVHQLSNRQLKVVNERLNLEQNYLRMHQHQSKTDAGHAAVKKYLGMATTAASIYTLMKSPPGQALINAGKSFVSTGKILKLIK
jgi:hypothetical protein